jgi:plasmid stabilization system protein ParE
MNAIILAAAEIELERAFDYYELQRSQLGLEFIEEFRRGVDSILEHPDAWQLLGDNFRRYRLHRFPFGIVFEIVPAQNQIVIHAVMHMSSKPRKWPRRSA